MTEWLHLTRRVGRQLGILLAVGLAVPPSALLAQALPLELSALAADAGLEGRLMVWCAAAFRPQEPGAYAVAVLGESGSGRYVVVERDGTVLELATFTGSGDLSCFGPWDAEQLRAELGSSQTIRGQIRPRWNTAMVCAFVENTAAVCWQYSPEDGRFVEVGGWVT